MDTKFYFTWHLLSTLLLIAVLRTNVQSEELLGPSYSRLLASEQSDRSFVPIALTSAGTRTVEAANAVNAVNAVTEQVAKGQQRKLQKRSVSIRLRDLQQFISQLIDNVAENADSSDGRAMSANVLFNERIVERIRRFIEGYIFDGSAPSAMQSNGRVFLFKGKWKELANCDSRPWHVIELTLSLQVSRN